MKTAFVIRDIPDLDHITPVLYKFLSCNEEIVILNFEINLNLENDFRINFLNNKFKNLKIINIHSFLDHGVVYKFLAKIFSINNFEINFKNLKNEKKYNINFLKNIIIALIKKYFFKKNSFLENFFFDKKWLKKIFKVLKIRSVVLDDSFYLLYKKAQNIVEVCLEEDLKIHLFPHTCYINDFSEDYNFLKNFKKPEHFPNYITNSHHRKKKLIECGVKEKHVLVYGSARFCPEWFEIFKEVTNCKINNTTSKTKVLYFVGIYNDQVLEKKLVNFLSELNNIELTVKSHPRGIFSKKQTTNQKETNLIVDYNTPSTKLIFENEIIIGTFSSILIDAFILNKTVIYPKFLMDPNKIQILFAGKGFSIDCANNEEVSHAISKYKDNKTLYNHNNLEKFMIEHVYANRDKNNILNDYVELLKPNSN